ncbi:dihydrofolate reductase family protein [Nocardia niigatensis]
MLRASLSFAPGRWSSHPRARHEYVCCVADPRVRRARWERPLRGIWCSDGSGQSLRRTLMVPVVYSMTVSLDGFIAGPGDDIGWTAPDPELMRFHNEQTRDLGAHVCGRRLYQTMLVWETAEQTMSDETDLEFARIWRPIPKVVFSRTLNSVEGNASLATGDIATEIGRLRDRPGGGAVAIGGAGIAAAAIAEDLVDEYRQFVRPIVLGDGTPYFPRLDRALDLRLVESRIFGSQVVYLRYQRVR